MHLIKVLVILSSISILLIKISFTQLPSENYNAVNFRIINQFLKNQEDLTGLRVEGPVTRLVLIENLALSLNNRDVLVDLRDSSAE